MCGATAAVGRVRGDRAIFDRGSYVAFANCGLPYYVGDVIADERTLLVSSPEMFRERFSIEVHTNTDVIDIDRAARTIVVRDLGTGNSRTERYDALVLSPGAAPIRPQLPGVDLPGVFAVRNIPAGTRNNVTLGEHHARTGDLDRSVLPRLDRVLFCRIGLRSPRHARVRHRSRGHAEPWQDPQLQNNPSA